MFLSLKAVVKHFRRDDKHHFRDLLELCVDKRKGFLSTHYADSKVANHLQVESFYQQIFVSTDLT